MKKSYMLIAFLMSSLVGFSQTGQQEVEKQIRDPQRKANAGKADVIILNKKNIYDSTTFNQNTLDATEKKNVKASARRKQCGTKNKKQH